VRDQFQCWQVEPLQQTLMVLFARGDYPVDHLAAGRGQFKPAHTPIAGVFAADDQVAKLGGQGADFWGGGHGEETPVVRQLAGTCLRLFGDAQDADVAGGFGR
jgi:hypothetical protein